MKKLSFSIPSKSESKPKPVSNKEQNTKQYITEFDPTKILQPRNTQTPIIQPLPDRKIENIGLPHHPDSSITPNASRRTEDVLLEKLRYDLENLPEDGGFEQFERMPVKDFGKAYLRGYGWHEERGVGKNAKEDVKIKQYTKGGFLPASHYSKIRANKRSVESIESWSVESRKSLKIGNGDVGRERGVQWLRSHTRVRIISKELNGGKLYLKKGEVVDVVGPYKCDISMDGSRELVQSVDQDALETALPRPGGPVLVLYGKHKGAYGNLVQRDLDREIGVVQDSSSHELLNVKLEQVAEYVGDPSYIGY